MDLQQENQLLFCNNSISLSSRVTERNNPFHSYLASNQIALKQIPESENNALPFEEQSDQEQNSPLPQSPQTHPHTSTDRRSVIYLQKIECYDNSSKKIEIIPILPKKEQDEQQNFLQVIRRKKIMKKFIEISKKKAYIFPKYLQEQFKKIKYEKYIHKKKIFSKKETDILQKSKSKLKFLPLFSPQQPLILIWEFVMFLLLLYISWWGPFTLTFEDGINQYLDQEQVIIYLGAIDILKTINTSIIFQGQILNDRYLLIKHYFKNNLLSDLFSIGIIAAISSRPKQDDYEILFILLVVLLLYFNQKRLRYMIDKIQETLDVQEDALDLIKVLLIILYFTHICACLWAKIAQQSHNMGYETWMDVHNITFKNSWIQYDYSLYWATMTMVTVGYGDVTPANPIEMVIAIIVMIISSVVFGYSLNSIGIILKNINDKQQTIRKSQLLINQYMNKNQVNSQLQSKVRNYIKFYMEQDNLQSDEELNQLISKLSPSLKDELLYDIQKKPLKSSNFITQQLSLEAQKQIAFNLQSSNFTPQEIIYNQNSKDDFSLYLIMEGQIGLIDEKSGTIIKNYVKGECFGQYEFFTCQQRQLQAKSLTFSRLYSLKREHMISILQDFKDDREKFLNIKDSLLLGDGFERIDLNCFFCQGIDHYFTKCTFLTYQPDLERLIKQEGFCNQKRFRFHRYKSKSGSALNLLILKNDEHQKFLIEIGVIDDESSSSSHISASNQIQSQSNSKQNTNSQEKQIQREEFTATGRIFLTTNPNNDNNGSSGSKPFSLFFDKYQQRKSKRELSYHTNLQTGQTPKTIGNDFEKQYTVSKRKRSQSIKEIKDQKDLTPRKRRNSSDSDPKNLPNNVVNKNNISFTNQQLTFTKKNNQYPTQSSQSFQEPPDIIKIMEEQEQIKMQFLNCDFEKSSSYKFYFPQNNLNQVLLQYSRAIKGFKNRARIDSNKYSIYYDQKKLSTLIRQQKNHRQSKVSSPSSKRIRERGQHKISVFTPLSSLQLQSSS